MTDLSIPDDLSIPNFLKRPLTPKVRGRIDRIMAVATAYNGRPEIVLRPWIPGTANTLRYAPSADPATIRRLQEERKEQDKIKTKSREVLKEQGIWIPGSLWDTRNCKWIHPSINEERQMPNKMTGEKTVAELTAEYNAIAKSEAGVKLGLKEVVKFKDLKTAKARLAKVNKDLGNETPKETKVKEPKEPKEPKKRLPFTHRHGDVVEQFDFRAASERERLLHVLLDHFEKMVTKASLGKLAVNVPGITWRIDNKKLPYELRETKNEGVISYGLFRKVLA